LFPLIEYEGEPGVPGPGRHAGAALAGPSDPFVATAA
jgi:hypothetical protein